MSTLPTRRAIASIAGAALAGTLLATYPLLFGKSLVSPGNGPVAMLYDSPPFTYSDTDPGMEPARGTDVGAMMWAILPYTVVQREALAHGEFPLWNRYNLNGQPLWGQGQTFFLDPFHLLSLGIADPSLAMDLRFIVGRAVFALGGGTAVVLATGSLPAAVIVAAAAPFAGHFISRLNHPAYFSIVYVPWVLAAFGGLLAAESRGAQRRAGVCLAVATWLQIVGSTPKEGAVALGAAYLAGMVAIIARPASWSERLARIDAVALAGAAAVLMAAPHWLLFLDTLSRAWTAYDQPAVQLAGASQAVAFALGSLAPGQPFTGTHPLFVVAAACALLAPGALVRSGLGIGALAATAFLGAVAFGIVPTSLISALPLVRNIHHVWDAFLAAAVPLVMVLAGTGIAAALSARGSRAWLMMVGVTAGAAALGVAWLVPETAPQTTRLLVRAAASGAALAVVALVAPIPAWARAAAVTAGAVAAVWACGLHLVTGVPALDDVLMQPRARADIGRFSPALRAMRDRAGDTPYRVAPVDTVLFPGTQGYWRVEGIGGPDAVRLPELDTLAEAGGLVRAWVWRPVLLPDRLAVSSAYLDMLGARFAVARADQVPAGTRVLPVDGDDRLSVIERPSAWPRAFFASGARRVEGTAGFIGHMLNATGPFAAFDPRDEAAVAAFGDLPGEGHAEAATGYSLTPSSTRFRIRSEKPGLAVLSESYVAEDFVATLNGERVPYYRVNRGMKAVKIPGPGEWDVRFEYRPRLWRWSWAMAAMGAAGLVFLWRSPARAARAN